MAVPGSRRTRLSAASEEMETRRLPEVGGKLESLDMVVAEWVLIERLRSGYEVIPSNEIAGLEAVPEDAGADLDGFDDGVRAL